MATTTPDLTDEQILASLAHELELVNDMAAAEQQGPLTEAERAAIVAYARRTLGMPDTFVDLDDLSDPEAGSLIHQIQGYSEALTKWFEALRDLQDQTKDYTYDSAAGITSVAMGEYLRFERMSLLSGRRNLLGAIVCTATSAKYPPSWIDLVD